MDNAEEQKRIKGNTVAYGIKIQVSVSSLPITEVIVSESDPDSFHIWWIHQSVHPI